MARDPRFHTWLGRPWRVRSGFVPAVATLVCVATASLVRVGVPFHWWVPTTVGVAGLAVLAAVLWGVGGERFHAAMQLFMLATAAMTALWMLYASFPGAWHPPLRAWTGGVALALTAAATIGWWACRRAQIDYETDRYRRLGPQHLALTAAPAPPPPPPPNEWEQMYAELGAAGLRFIGRRQDNDGNLMIRMRLPENGKITFESIRPLCDGIEVALSHRRARPLPPGSIIVERYRDPKTGRVSSTDFVVHVNVVDILSQTIMIPENHERRSIQEAFTIGNFQDGKPFFMTVREIHWFIVAISGNGKSNLLHAVIYWCSLCYDCVIWMIDMKGGATARVHLRAWLDRAKHPVTREPTRRPVLDWVGVDRHEAERIYGAFIAIANDRYFRMTGSRVTPSAKRPHLLLITDEQARVTGRQTGPAYSSDEAGLSGVDFASLETDAAAIARASACSLMKATQRGTVTTAGNNDATANYKGRICLGAADQQDARMVHPKSAIAAQLAAAIKTVGTMLASADSPADREVPVKVHFLGDDDDLETRLYYAAILRGNYVPGLHECGPRCDTPCEYSYDYEIACQHGYRDRWDDPERAGWLNATRRGPWLGKPIRQPAAADPATKTATQLLAEMDNPDGTPATTTPAPRGFFRPPTARPAAAPVAPPATETDPDLARLADSLGADFITQFTADLAALDDATADTEPPAPSALDQVEAIVDRYGTQGCRWSTLVLELRELGLVSESSANQASRWLKALRRDDRITRFPAEGPTGRWYTPRHLRRAA